MTLAPGTRLGPYEITGAIGAGGMGEVYRARDTRLNPDVVIKVLPELFAADPERMGRFEREAQAVAALSYPNILAIHDFGRDGATSYAVMELLEGETLRERIASAPQPVRRATELAVQIARGLAAAHERGIVHRDLKPENLFVTRDGRVKILDFGLARHAGAMEPSDLTVPVTDPGTVLGTVGYMSPEPTAVSVGASAHASTSRARNARRRFTWARLVRRTNSVRSTSVITTAVLGRPIFAMPHKITPRIFLLANPFPGD